jgi:hypothetical protein
MGMMAAVPTLDRFVQHAPPRMTEVWGMECKWPRRETQIEVGEKKQSSEDPRAPDLCAPQAESGKIGHSSDPTSQGSGGHTRVCPWQLDLSVEPES